MPATAAGEEERKESSRRAPRAFRGGRKWPGAARAKTSRDQLPVTYDIVPCAKIFPVSLSAQYVPGGARDS